MWWQNKRLDRIEVNIERLAEISEATNRRIDRFVEATDRQFQAIQLQVQAIQTQVQGLENRTEQLQRAVEYLLSQDK